MIPRFCPRCEEPVSTHVRTADEMTVDFVLDTRGPNPVAWTARGLVVLDTPLCNRCDHPFTPRPHAIETMMSSVLLRAERTIGRAA